MRRRGAGRRSRPPLNTAFVNVPYDPDYEKLFIALIAGLSGFGLDPNATVGSKVSRSEAAVLAKLEAAFAPGPRT